jgi:hypothetical protein
VALIAYKAYFLLTFIIQRPRSPEDMAGNCHSAESKCSELIRGTVVKNPAPWSCLLTSLTRPGLVPWKLTPPYHLSRMSEKHLLGPQVEISAG